MDNHDEGGDPVNETTVPVSKARRRVGQVLVVVAAAFALFTAGWGMWHFFWHRVGITDWYMVLPMFLLFDFAGIACAWNARINRIEHGRIGVEGWLVWLFATLSGLMSASDATNVRAQAVRFAAPLVAAILFELLIRGERKDATGDDETGLVGRIKRRILARLGLLDSLDLDDAAAARASAAARIAVLAYRVHQTTEGSRGRRRAVRRYHRRVRSATERFRFATDAEMVDAVRAHLAALYQSVSGTAETALVDLNVWRAADARPVQAVAEKVDDDVAALCELVRLQARQARTAVTAGLAYNPALASLPAAPPAPVVPPVDDIAALVVAPQEPATRHDGGPDIENATGPDSEAPVSPDNGPDTDADKKPAADRTRRTPRKRPAKATGRAKDNATRVANLRAKQPDMTQAEVATRLKISTRTVSRLWADTTPDTAHDSEADAQPVNGHAVAALVTTE